MRALALVSAFVASTLRRVMLVLTQLIATCAICGSSKADNTAAFMATTLALALVPVAIFGCGLFFVVRAHRRSSADHD